MTRRTALFFLLAILPLCAVFLPAAAAQESAPPPENRKNQEGRTAPPDEKLRGLKEEDESLTEQEYSFNPLQADKEMQVGDFYARKGNYRAAAMRYQEAVKWNPGLAQAYLKLGRMREKMKDADGAKEAFRKYLELAPQAKEASEIARKYNLR